MIREWIGTFRSGMLQEVLPEFAPPEIPVHVLHHGDMVPLKVRAFIDFCVPRLQARPAL